MEKRRRFVREADPAVIHRLETELKIPHVLAGILAQRGIKTFEEARIFFRPELSHLHDPMLMQDMDKAVARLHRAISSNEKILVYGDYDVDGTTAVALVFSFLEKWNADAGYYIPDRYKEGYGISTAGIDYAAEHGYGLIIALDCGIKSNDKVEYARSKGIDFIICDHHRPGEVLPAAVAVLDPKRMDCNYPFKELTGCGIGYKLLQAYAKTNGIADGSLHSGLDLLAVSIAADIVPVTGENRILMFHGLKQIAETPSPGLQMLIKTNTAKRELEVSDLVFTLAPRINAAGRIGHATMAVELLLAPDAATAEKFAERLNKTNTDRKDIDLIMTQQALEMVASRSEWVNRNSTVVFDDSWHKGVVGIVASRLIEKYYRPTIVLTASDGMATGSARSVKGFDVYEAIEACSDLLVQFGGHKYAAGLTLKAENVDAFREKFEAAVSARISPEMLIPEVEIDAPLSLNAIDGKFYRILKQFAPFGPGNMNPVFFTDNVNDRGWLRIVGTNHLKMDIVDPAQPARIFPAMGFGMGEHYMALAQQKSFSMCYCIEENEFNGKIALQLGLKDVVPAM